MKKWDLPKLQIQLYWHAFFESHWAIPQWDSLILADNVLFQAGLGDPPGFPDAEPSQLTFLKQAVDRVLAYIQ